MSGGNRAAHQIMALKGYTGGEIRVYCDTCGVAATLTDPKAAKRLLYQHFMGNHQTRLEMGGVAAARYDVRSR